MFLAASGLLAQAPPALPFLEEVRSAALVVLAPEEHPIAQAARQSMREQELAELEPSLVILDPDLQGKRYREARAALPALPVQGWALLSPKGILLASGTGLPAASNLAKALEAAGIRSPIKALRAFLRNHPDHLEARSDLLRILRKGAQARTLSLQERRAAKDTGLPPGKRLGPTEDLEIWGAYAQELDRAFQDGSWRGMELGLEATGDLPLEASSPTVQSVCLRHTPKVEQALSILPGSPSLWQVWLRMTAISGARRSRALIQGLTVPPPELRMEWPPKGVVAALVQDARKSGEWWLVRDMLQPFWEEWKERMKGTKPRGLGADWAGSLGPLLESMLRTQAEGEACELAASLAASPETRPLLGKAVALATACRRQDLAQRWLALRR